MATRSRVRALVLALVAAVSLVAGPLPAAGPAEAAVTCQRIDARGEGQDLGGGNTTATITGGGLLDGTTAARFAVTGGAPPVLAIAGTVTFTTDQGTLTVAVRGTLNVTSGAFVAVGPVTAATGGLAGARGALTFRGVQNLVSGQFTETVTGVVCVDLAP